MTKFMLDSPPPTYYEWYMSGKNPIFYVISSFEKEVIYSKVWLEFSYDNYVGIMVIFISFGDYGWYESNDQHSISDLLNTNSVYLYKRPQEKNSKNMFTY